MDEHMETVGMSDAPKRYATEEDSSPRERKKPRKGRGKKMEIDTPSSYESNQSTKKTTIKIAAVSPELTARENGVKIPNDDNEGNLATPPAALQQVRESPPDKARPIVTFAPVPTEATATSGSDGVLYPASMSPPPPPGTATSRFPSLFRMLLILFGSAAAAAAFLPRTTSIRSFQHVIPPKHAIDSKAANTKSVILESFLSNVTLREFLTDPEGFHLAMAPSFFGFFGYFGLLAAWDEGLLKEPTGDDDGGSASSASSSSFLHQTNAIKSVAGASAGAMAATLLAVGIPPRKAAEFCETIDLPTFADPPGIGAVFKGDKFEQLMFDFIKENLPDDHSMQMEDANIPVAVTGFDLQTLSTLVMTKGCVARSSRASATFPFLFQPVHFITTNTDDDDGNNKTRRQDYVLIDGGVLDGDGLIGLSSIEPDQPNKRVVNVVVGNFGGTGTSIPPGPSQMPPGLVTTELLSISMRNLPGCGPWAMENGPRAVEAAKRAMMASLDLPLYRGREEGHYELHIDASSFAPPR